MQAIQTKYLPPSNTRGSRYKASCDRGSIVVSSCYNLNCEENHKAAADSLRKQFVAEDTERYGTRDGASFWAGPFVSGGLPDGTWAHVYIVEKGVTK